MSTMRMVIVHPYPVHQRAVGGTTRVLALVRFLVARGHRVAVLAHADSLDADRDDEACRDLARLGAVQRVFPRPTPSVWRKFAWGVGRTPYHVHRNRSPLLEAALADIVDRGDADVVHLEFGYLSDLLPPRRSVVYGLAEQEVMSIARTRLASTSFANRTWYERAAVYAAARVRAYERRSLPRFDVLFGITSAEAEVLSTSSGRPAGVLPHVVDTSRFVVCQHARTRDRVLFVGNFAHAPNVHAVRWFMNEVWPRVRAVRTSASWVIAGPGLPAGLATQLRDSGAEVRGYVGRLEALYHESTVFANPVHVGGGMRGKVLEAMASGLPVVSTSLGLDGIAGTDRTHHLIADTADAFTAAILEVLDSPRAAEHIGAAARALVVATYDVAIVCGRLEAAYLEAVHRRRLASAAGLCA